MSLKRYIVEMDEEIAGILKNSGQIKILESSESSIEIPSGFDKEILYHGTNVMFDEFDSTKRRTARHIYTTPDLNTAKGYGRYVLRLYAKQAPQANLEGEAFDYDAARKIWQNLGLEDDYTFDEFIELLGSGNIYNGHASSSLQDAILDAAFDLGYNSVRLFDTSSTSVVFDDPKNLKIIERIETPLATRRW